MDLETLLSHEGFDYLKAAIRSTYGKAKRRRLIAQAIRELLALDPDIDAADARLRAARALGLGADDLELRAERLLDRTRKHGSPPPKKSERKTARRSAIRVSARRRD